MTQAITQELNRILADYQVLYQKLRTYHWNVTGPMFFSLHQKFEELYTETATLVDEVAERVAALGDKPLPTLAAQVAAARLSEDDGSPSAEQMVRNLVEDYESLIGTLRTAAKQAEGDAATFNLLEGFADGHTKTAWMLRAYLSA